MGETQALKSRDGFEFSVFRAAPRGKRQGALVLLQEVFGLTPFLEDIASRWAMRGYDVFVPALLDRSQRNLALAYDAPGISRGHGMALHLGVEKPLEDIQATLDHAAEVDDRVAVLGFGWGATLAFLTACKPRRLRCAVGYCGNDIPRHAQEAEVKAPTLLHFASLDQGVSGGDISFVRHQNRQAEVQVYRARSAFYADDRPHFDAAAAKLAEERTLAFVGEHVKNPTKRSAPRT
jgi:carboxymethylenebutenolidase